MHKSEEPVKVVVKIGLQDIRDAWSERSCRKMAAG